MISKWKSSNGSGCAVPGWWERVYLDWEPSPCHSHSRLPCVQTINHRPHVKSPIQVTEQRFTSSICFFIRYLFRHVSKECLKNGCVSSQVQAAVRKRQTCLRRIPSFILKNDGCVLTQQMQIERWLNGYWGDVIEMLQMETLMKQWLSWPMEMLVRSIRSTEQWPYYCDEASENRAKMSQSVKTLT